MIKPKNQNLENLQEKEKELKKLKKETEKVLMQLNIALEGNQIQINEIDQHHDILTKFSKKIIEISEVHPNNAQENPNDIELGLWLKLKTKNPPSKEFGWITNYFHDWAKIIFNQALKLYST